VVRIATATILRQGVDAMQRLQSNLSKTQQQISSGRRIVSPSDDPVGAAHILELTRGLEETAQYQRNGEIARNRLSLEEESLIGVGNILQRARELALQANNASQSDETRGFMATELREMQEQLVQIANTRDAAGQYLFAGFKARTEPFVRNATGFQYAGDQGQRLVQIGQGRQVADGDPGSEVFQMIRVGNGVFSTAADAANTGTGVIGTGTVVDPTALVPDSYTVNFITPTDYEVLDSGGGLVVAGVYSDGDAISFNGMQFDISGQPAAGDSFAVAPAINQDMFTTLENLASALEASTLNDTGRARLHNDINDGIANLDQAIGQVLEIRTRVGTRLSTIESQRDLNDGIELQLSQTLSAVQDLDYAEALTSLNQQLATLDAAQQTFVRVQGLSLFNSL
jgi:flagellar hook-associated protein 3 FlgL